MGSNYRLKYNVDIVLCIDATYSMTGILDTVKRNAVNFPDDLKRTMEQKGKHINQLRMRIIAFRDYMADGEKAMLATDFFALPEEKDSFKDLIMTIEPDGGGDDPEDGLEALAYAIRSDWTKGGDKRRHVIVVWTDASTHEIGFGRKSQYYPQGMPKTFGELTELWDERMDGNAKRLLIYAPDEEYWSTISDCWDNTLHFMSVAGNGLEEVEYKEILSEISNTI